MASGEFASPANGVSENNKLYENDFEVLIGFRSGYTGFSVLESLSRNRLEIKLRLNTTA
jgi:hypothetical protein